MTRSEFCHQPHCEDSTLSVRKTVLKGHRRVEGVPFSVSRYYQGFRDRSKVGERLEGDDGRDEWTGSGVTKELQVTCVVRVRVESRKRRRRVGRDRSRRGFIDLPNKGVRKFQRRVYGGKDVPAGTGRIFCR